MARAATTKVKTERTSTKQRKQRKQTRYKTAHSSGSGSDSAQSHISVCCLASLQRGGGGSKCNSCRENSQNARYREHYASISRVLHRSLEKDNYAFADGADAIAFFCQEYMFARRALHDAEYAVKLTETAEFILNSLREESREPAEEEAQEIASVESLPTNLPTHSTTDNPPADNSDRWRPFKDELRLRRQERERFTQLVARLGAAWARVEAEDGLFDQGVSPK